MLLNDLAEVPCSDSDGYVGISDEDDVKPSDPIHHLFLKVLQTAIEDLESDDPLLRSNALEFFKAKISWLPWGISYADIQEFYPLSAKHTKKIKELLHSQIIRI